MRFFLLFVTLACALCSDENEKEVSQLHRSDTLPIATAIMALPDHYFEGYIQALIDVHFHEYGVAVTVKDHEVWLYNLPQNKLIANSIIAFVQDIAGVKTVKAMDGLSTKEKAAKELYVKRPQIKGIWFPQMTEIFLPLIASPRQAIYSIGYRGGDRVCGKTAVPVSLGDDFAVFRWINVLPWHGDMQIGIEAAIWSVFNVNVKGYNPQGGAELVNTDFYVGIPIAYGVHDWSFRLRPYHISSHLGDEFMVDHPGFKRLNPSFEAIDFFSSYQTSEAFRLYFGPGIILHSDKSFPMKYCYLEYGFETRFGGSKMYYHKLYGTFFFAGHFRQWQVLHFKPDGTYVLGYEWSKLQGVGRKIRLMLEFHHGFSLEGQFFKRHTNYGGIKFAYGF